MTWLAPQAKKNSANVAAIPLNVKPCPAPDEINERRRQHREISERHDCVRGHERLQQRGRPQVTMAARHETRGAEEIRKLF